RRGLTEAARSVVIPHAGTQGLATIRQTDALYGSADYRHGRAEIGRSAGKPERIADDADLAAGDPGGQISVEEIGILEVEVVIRHDGVFNAVDRNQHRRLRALDIELIEAVVTLIRWGSGRHSSHRDRVDRRG